jgi:hypothetical protein
MRAAAAAVVELLSGTDPAMPPNLALPDAVQNAAPDGIEDGPAWFEQQWGWVALTWWCRYCLSSGQRAGLQRQHYDLNELGIDFFQFMTCCSDADGDPCSPRSSYVLGAACPPAVLREWFGRFLTASDSPFEKSLCWKLKRRFDDILEGDSRFTRVGDTWKLVANRGDPGDAGANSTENLHEHLARAVGRLKPLLYKQSTEDREPEPKKSQGNNGKKRKKRGDPIIRKIDALRVAQEAIAFAGPVNSKGLALACLELLPKALWCEIIRDQDTESGPGTDGSRADRDHWNAVPDGAEAEPPPGADHSGAGISLRQEDLASRARQAWEGLSPHQRIVAAARLVLDPPWTFQEIQDWTLARLRPEYHLKLQRAYDRAGRDDTRIKAELRAALPPDLCEDGNDNALAEFLKAMADEARKTLASPPSHWMNDEPQERRPPAHE